MSLRSLRVVPLVVLAISAVLVLPYGGLAKADSSLLANQLILTNPATGATVQMMPTTAWIAQHPKPTGSGGGSTTATASGSLPSPTCTLGTDSSPDDAHVLVNNSSTQYDSLDLSAFGLSS